MQDQKIIFLDSYKYKDQIKKLSFRKWNPDDKVWESRLNVLPEIIKMFQDDCIDPVLKGIALRQDLLKSKSGLLESNEVFDINDFGHGKEMLPFQKAGLEFIELSGGRCLVADEPGLGKTIQALSYIQLHPELRPAIIVCPNSLKFNWRNEVNNWLDTDDSTSIITPTKYTTSEINIINYDLLSKYKSKLVELKAKTLVLDECHLIKNEKAIRSKVIKTLSKNIKHIIGLTGTPVMSNPVELYNQLHILYPHIYTKDAKFSFMMNYCDPHNNGFGYQFKGASNTDKLAEELKSFMIRRTKAQVLPELPAKRRSSIVLPLKNKTEYSKHLNEFREFMDEYDSTDQEQRKFMLTEIEELKQLAVLGKIDDAIDWITQTFIENEQKVIVFATHHKTIDILMEHFGSIAVCIDGRISQNDREQAVYQFQNNPDIKIFVGNIQAAGVGLTLTSASNVVFLEFGWVAAMMDQCEDRAHRYGQHDAVNCYYVVAENSIDQYILNLLESKRKMVNEIMDDDSELDFRFTDSIKKFLKNG